MNYKKKCLFCDFINKNKKCFIIYENNYTLSFLDIFPKNNGHSLVIPKKHFKYLSTTNNKYLSETIKSTKKIVKNIYKKLKPSGINYIINEKSWANQEIFHFHIHIIPKFKNDSIYYYNNNIEDIYKKIINN